MHRWWQDCEAAQGLRPAFCYWDEFGPLELLPAHKSGQQLGVDTAPVLEVSTLTTPQEWDTNALE